MNIVMVGTGYVGLVSGTCFAEFGYQVTCVDKDINKINTLQQGEVPIYEPGLKTLIHKNTKSNRLHFTTDLATAVAQADIVFIAVGTPQNGSDGAADLQYVMKAADEIGTAMTGYTVIVNKSTVPVDTAAQLTNRLQKHHPEKEFDVVSNPEFLREGSAIEDFMTPDRVVVGALTQRAKKAMQTLYQPLVAQNIPLLITTPETSELIKYASNSFLATKIAFINELATLCEKTKANVQDVARGIGLDHRIGTAFLNAGPGYGGSCFPKDTRALATTARQLKAPLSIVEQVIASNDQRKVHLAERIVTIVKHANPAAKTIAILGVTFKPETDDMRESPSLVIIPLLQEAGFIVRAYDPEGMPNAKMHLHNVSWCKDAYEAAHQADALVILTEWNEFKSLNFVTLKEKLSSPFMIDYRNLYQPTFMQQQGFTYHSLGRLPIKSKP